MVAPMAGRWLMRCSVEAAEHYLLRAGCRVAPPEFFKTRTGKWHKFADAVTCIPELAVHMVGDVMALAVGEADRCNVQFASIPNVVALIV